MHSYIRAGVSLIRTVLYIRIVHPTWVVVVSSVSVSLRWQSLEYVRGGFSTDKQATTHSIPHFLISTAKYSSMTYISVSLFSPNMASKETPLSVWEKLDFVPVAIRLSKPD
jgi:hypothetical protein